MRIRLHPTGPVAAGRPTFGSAAMRYAERWGASSAQADTTWAADPAGTGRWHGWYKQVRNGLL